MDFVGAIVAGPVGTAAMTALMAIAPMMGMPKMDVIGMLGTMVTTDRGTATVVGTLAHFMMA